jgi:molecular chaperone DnaJ
MKEKNFYDILELSNEERKLNGEEFNKVLKNKYKKLALQWHPDKFSTKTEEERKNAEEKFKEISEAYNTLSDQQKKQQYDFMQNGGFNGGFNPFGTDFDPFDVFGMRSQQQRIYKGNDIQVKIDVDLKDVYYGGKKTFSYDRLSYCVNCNGTGSSDGKTTTCPHCNGSGMVTEVTRRGNMQMMSSHPCPHCNGTGIKINNPCPHCNGEGMKKETITETVDIPRGVISGAYTTISGKGDGLPKGINGINGDLIVIFNIINNDIFEIIDDNGNGNINTKMKINVFNALLGYEQEITCIDDSKVKVKIPELTKNGHNFIIKGKGLPKFKNSSQYGDLIVTLEYELPKKLSEKQKVMLKNIIES